MTVISPTYTPETNRYFDGQANYEVSGLWRFDIVPEGLPTGLFDPSLSYTFTGDEAFNGGFSVNSPVSTSIFSGDGLNLGANNTVNIFSTNQQVNINADNGNVVIHGNSGTFSTDNGMNIFTTGGDLNHNTSNGNFNVFAGTSGTAGGMTFGSDHGDINMFTSGVGNVIINTNGSGQVSLSANGASISLSPTGIGMGVNAGAGMTVSNVNGDFSFGTGTGNFLIGALAGSVSMLAGTTFGLSAGTGINLTSSTGDLELVATVGVVKITTQTQASVGGAPSSQPPMGFSYVIMENSSGNIYRMT